MYKEVTGLAGKVIALVIGISLFFSKMFSSWLLKTQCFQLTECQPWILVMFLEQKWAQSGAEDDSCPHCVLLQACIELHNNSFTSLQHITQGPDGVFPNSAQFHKYSFGGAGKALRWPFFLQYCGIRAQESEASLGLEGRTEQLVKAVRDALGMCLEPLLMVFTENPDSSSWL